jgi:pimeloyl-ACP methyl ester carboxylesterase
MTKTTDKVVLLGERKSIVAIATQPAAAAEAVRPAIIILNTGIIHRVGHNRMYVTLARELAELGHTVLRLDQSGIGDSDARPDVLDPLLAGLVDIKDAIDWLSSSKGVKSVILMGLCSGANHSVVYAGSDPRVVGTVLLDPSIPPTARYHLNDFGERLMRSETWKNLLLGKGRAWRLITRRSPKAAVEDWAPDQLSFKNPEIRAFVENAYARAVSGGNQLLAIFTGGMKYQHNYRRQLLDAMPNVRFGNQLRIEYLARCDHTFMLATDRRWLFETVKAWLRTTKFADPAAAAPERVVSEFEI